MNLKIAICDDETVQIEYLTEKVSWWAKDKNYCINLKTFPSSEAFLFTYCEEKDFDILLLDIEMKEMNGVELAKRVREDNTKVQIIFITGFPDFMSEGYEVAALHYLMKPVSENKLYQVLDRAVGNIYKKEDQLDVHFDRQTVYIPFRDINYIEAQLQYVIIHTSDTTYKMKASLTEIEKKLNDNFFRCQRSFLVNLSWIKKIKSDCVIMKNDENVPISRGMNEKIGKAMITRL